MKWKIIDEDVLRIQIKNKRLSKKLSTRTLAKLCGFKSQTTIQTIESGDKALRIKDVNRIFKELYPRNLFMDVQ